MKKPHPLSPSEAPPGAVWFGGPVAWFSISLSFTADDLDPDEVTRLLGVEPDEARRSGVPDTRGRTPPSGAWVLSLRREQAPQCDVGVAIGRLLDRIPASADVLGLARAHANARVFVGVRLDAFNRGLVLSTDLMSRLVNLGLRFDLDIYADETCENQQ